MRKYGVDKFKFEVIEECHIDELNDREKYWINYYDSYKNGYNSTPGGDNAPHSIKITSDMLNEIDNYLRCDKIDIQSIADIFDVSYEMIQGINTGRYWHREIEYPIRKRHDKNKNFCIDCGKEIDTKSIRCWECHCKSKLKNGKPDKETLLKLILENSKQAIGRMFGVNGNTIKKWCIKYEIPYNKDDAINYLNDNNIIV